MLARMNHHTHVQMNRYRQGPASARNRRFQSPEGIRHERISEMASNACGDNDRNRGFRRTRPRPRRRSKYHELAGLSAAASGIEAAIVTTRRKAARTSTQDATPALTDERVPAGCGTGDGLHGTGKPRMMRASGLIRARAGAASGPT